MEVQLHGERAAATKASDQQLHTIKAELHTLKEKQDRDAKGRKAEEKVPLDNTKANIDPILKPDFKSSDQIREGAKLKNCKKKLTTIAFRWSIKVWSCNFNPRYYSQLEA